MHQTTAEGDSDRHAGEQVLKTARPGDVLQRSSTRRLIEHSVALFVGRRCALGVLTVLWPFTTAILFGAALAIAPWPLRQAMAGGASDEGWPWAKPG